MTPTLLRLSLITALLSAALITVMNLIGATIPTRMAIYTSLDWIAYGLFDTRTCISKILNVGDFFYPIFAWSPNGDKIANVHELNEQTNIYVMDWTGENLRALITAQRIGFGLTWTPDNRLVFLFSISGHRTFYTIDLETKALTPIIDRQNMLDQIAFHPHLNYAAIVIGPPSEQAHIELINLETNTTTCITPLSKYGPFSPRWSPDGTRLIYPEMSSINMITFSADLSTHTAPQQLESRLSSLSHVTWLNDDEILIGMRNGGRDPLRFSVLRLQPTEYSPITYEPALCLPPNASNLALSP